MYGNCLNCKCDVSELMNWDTLCHEYIECPECKLKMKVEYEEHWQEGMDDEDSYWWLERFTE
jgi:hypothetical protein